MFFLLFIDSKDGRSLPMGDNKKEGTFILLGTLTRVSDIVSPMDIDTRKQVEEKGMKHVLNFFVYFVPSSCFTHVFKDFCSMRKLNKN